MRPIKKLRLILAECADIDVMCCIVRMGVAGPDGAKSCWIVQTETEVSVERYPPTEFLIIRPGGNDERLAVILEDDIPIINAVGVQAMLDISGRIPEIVSFGWNSVYYFAKGTLLRMDD